MWWWGGQFCVCAGGGGVNSRNFVVGWQFFWEWDGKIFSGWTSQKYLGVKWVNRFGSVVTNYFGGWVTKLHLTTGMTEEIVTQTVHFLLENMIISEPSLDKLETFRHMPVLLYIL